MRDVARAAGVSQQTVSRVVNDAAAVRDSTRRRVLEAVQRLGYQRNDAASRLARGPRRTAARTSSSASSSATSRRDRPPAVTDHRPSPTARS
ncbi:LacI family DNA-binding transcriptional regulator [Kineococcus sp. T90]|nr:LacI family DNA-binding transcriptional regulator [Kineococcus indalonis]